MAKSKHVSDITIHVDPVFPEQTLELCAAQIDMLIGFLDNSGDKLWLQGGAIVGICETLRATVIAMHEVQELVHARRPQAEA